MTVAPIVEPDADAIAVALRALLADPDRRMSLGAAGYARAQDFTWAASASAHVASYKRAADQGGRGRAQLNDVPGATR